MASQAYIKSIADLLESKDSAQSGTPLIALLQKAHYIEIAQQRLNQQLPQPIQGQVQLGQSSHDEMTIITPRASHLTWLRFEQQRLLILLRSFPGLESLKQLHFKVRPLHKKGELLKNMRFISTEASQILQECATNTDDKKLAAALRRLASRNIVTSTSKPEQG